MKDSMRQRIFKSVKEFLEARPQGARYSEIISFLKNQFSNTPENTLHGSLWEFRQTVLEGKEKDIIIPARGEYIHVKYQANFISRAVSKKEKTKIREEDFYNKFADYLINELEECTRAITLGGNKFQDKWGTPDVFGIYKFSEADPIKPPLEILSVEIKLDTSQLITALGQACAYKLFSHKVYLVVPKQAESDISRLESLCMKFGIGLILFDADKPDEPDFQIRTRAIKSEPDYYFVNAYIQRLDKMDIKKLLG